ncbi:hypothetical protein chiPu_0011761 [Chiloscyllium punctatum]|uniref:Serine-threonine kinase receptor-associated protein n=1 Tax=Chiloscyllium punctatum TaxID=137246 RepID=A0A401SSF6_CHIPU|nr:hypothetical protein [Chiloscyllium punctatum]
MRQTPLTCSGHTRPVVDLAFSGITPYGYFLISACKDGKPMMRQGDTGDWIGTFLGHKGAVWGATLNKEANRAATAAADFSAKVWDAVTGDEMITLAHKHIVKTVDFTQDSNNLLTGGQDKVLRIYDLNKPESEPLEISGHSSGIKKALWCNGDRQIISAADDKTVRYGILLKNSSLSISIFVVLKDVFVAGGDDFKLYKFDYNTGEDLESYKGHFGPVHCVRFSPDGELYASGSEDGTLRLWQTTVGKTYGLWKCVLPEELGSENSDSIYGTPPEVKA